MSQGQPVALLMPLYTFLKTVVAMRGNAQIPCLTMVASRHERSCLKPKVIQATEKLDSSCCNIRLPLSDCLCYAVSHHDPILGCWDLPRPLAGRKVCWPEPRAIATCACTLHTSPSVVPLNYRLACAAQCLRAVCLGESHQPEARTFELASRGVARCDRWI